MNLTRIEFEFYRNKTNLLFKEFIIPVDSNFIVKHKDGSGSFASSVLLMDSLNNVLLIKNVKRKKWFEFVGGKVSIDESFFHGCLREIREEVGIDSKEIRSLIPLILFLNRFTHQDEEVIHKGVFFLAR